MCMSATIAVIGISGVITAKSFGRNLSKPPFERQKNVQEIYIPNWHPTPLNKLIGKHHHVAHRLKSRDKHFVGVYSKFKTTIATTKRRVHLHIILGPGQRKCDPDAYFKSLLDALTHHGLLVNDSDNWVELSPVRYSRSTTSWGTEISLVDIE